MTEPKISRYLGIFVAALVAITLATMALSRFASVDIGGLYMSFIQLIVSSMIAGQQFVKDNGRAPTKQERARLVGYSFGMSLLIPAIMIGIMAAVGFFAHGPIKISESVLLLHNKLPIVAWLGIIAVFLALTYLPIHLGYGFLTSLLDKKLRR